MHTCTLMHNRKLVNIQQKIDSNAGSKSVPPMLAVIAATAALAFCNVPSSYFTDAWIEKNYT